MSGAFELAMDLEEAERDAYRDLLKLEAEDARTVASAARLRVSETGTRHAMTRHPKSTRGDRK